MPSRQTLTIGKEAMRKLRHFCVDAELRPFEVVEAMILREDFEKNAIIFTKHLKENNNLGEGGNPP